KLVGKIQSAGQHTDGWHDYIFDQRIDDRTERSTNDYADGKIDCATFDGEFLEFLPHLFHTTMLTSFLGTTITLRTVLPAIRSLIFGFDNAAVFISSSVAKIDIF